MSSVVDHSMTRVCLCMLGLAGCVRSPVPQEPVAAPPRISAWAAHLGPILASVRDCARKDPKDPDTRATVLGARTLRTGEIAVMTRSQSKGVRVCVHDGHEVVYEKSVALPKQELRGLPFVTLLGSTQPVQTPCLSVRELRWGIRVLGWLAVPRCQEGGGKGGAR